jgi:hypothetical protein
MSKYIKEVMSAMLPMFKCEILSLKLMLKRHVTQYGHSFQEQTYISNKQYENDFGD